MISFPNAKINLGLNILSKRPDGYHTISSCFYPVGWTDILEIIPAGTLTFTSSGIDIPGNADDNLCLRAYHLLREDHDLSPVHIHLYKIIPIGAGLGGGSADGAFALKMLNDQFNLGLSQSELKAYARRLGADCPFFIRNKPAIVSGIGDQFEKIDLDLAGKYIALVYPKVHISTKEAYSGIIPSIPNTPISDIISQPIESWKSSLTNDFEHALSNNHPEIQTIKNDLYEIGATYASMTGSGSAVYGIFQQDMQEKLEGKFSDFQVWKGKF